MALGSGQSGIQLPCMSVSCVERLLSASAMAPGRGGYCCLHTCCSTAAGGLPQDPADWVPSHLPHSMPQLLTAAANAPHPKVVQKLGSQQTMMPLAPT